LLCPDYFGRYAFISILEAAMKAIAPYEEASLSEECRAVFKFQDANDQRIDQNIKVKKAAAAAARKKKEGTRGSGDYSDDDDSEDYDDDDDDEFQDDIQITMFCIRDVNDNFIGVPNYKSPSIAVDFIRCIIAFLSETAQRVFAVNFKSSDEIMLLIQKMAECHPLVRECFISHNAIAKLVYLITEENCPPLPRVVSQSYNKFRFNDEGVLSFKNPFEYHTTFENLNVKVRKMIRLVYPQPAVEAILALLNVAQIQKVPLLCDTKSKNDIGGGGGGGGDATHNVFKERDMHNWFDQSLTPDAEHVLRNIFKNHCPNGTYLEPKDLAVYLRHCGVHSEMITKAYLEGLLLKYGQAPSRKVITLDGFLEYYRQVLMSNPKEVWSHLTALGYRNDLTHPVKSYCVTNPRSSEETSDRNQQQTSLDSKCAVQLPKEDSDHHEPLSVTGGGGGGDGLKLPLASAQAIVSSGFYEALSDIDTLEDVLPALIRRVCIHHEKNSLALILNILRETVVPCTSGMCVQYKSDLYIHMYSLCYVYSFIHLFIYWLFVITIDREAGELLTRTRSLIYAQLSIDDGLRQKRLGYIFDKTQISLLVAGHSYRNRAYSAMHAQQQHGFDRELNFEVQRLKGIYHRLYYMMNELRKNPLVFEYTNSEPVKPFISWWVEELRDEQNRQQRQQMMLAANMAGRAPSNAAAQQHSPPQSPLEAPDQIIVHGCGWEAVNGTYYKTDKM
jgi:hypothetical protein